MSCQRRLHCDLGSLPITHFANHDDVGILAQDRAQRIGKSEIDLRMHLNLVDALQLVFHGIFNGDDLLRTRIKLGKRRIQRRRFT